MKKISIISMLLATVMAASSLPVVASASEASVVASEPAPITTADSAALSGGTASASIADPITKVKDGYTRITFTDEHNSALRENTTDGNFKIVSKSDASLSSTKYSYAMASMHASATNIGRDYPSFVVYNGVDCTKPAKALDISYGGNYGFAFNLNTKHGSYRTTNRNYAVITYATEAEDNIELRLTWGYSLNPAVNRQIGGTYTQENGKWQSVSFQLTGPWKDGREKLGIYSNDEFYIRELVFFESKDDAEKYALRAGAYFNGEDYSEIKAMYIDPINSVTAKSIRYTFTENNITDSGFATIKDHGNGLETKENPQNVFTFNDGRVPYVNAKGVPRGAPSNSGKNKWGMSIVFNGLGKSLTKNDDVYIIATYQSDSENDHVIGVYPITYDKRVDIARVVKNTQGWCASEPFSVNAQAAITTGTYAGQTLFERLAARELILYTSAADVDGLNIREIVFIADKDQAKDYATAATAYYNAIENNIDPHTILEEIKEKNREENQDIIKLIMLLVGRKNFQKDIAILDSPFENIDPSSYSIIDFSSKNEEKVFSYQRMIVSEPQDPLPVTTKYNGIECAKMTPWYSGIWYIADGGSTQHMAFTTKKSAFQEDDIRYYVVQYASVSEVDHSLYLWTPNDSGNEVTKIADVKAGRTDWCITDVLSASTALYNRMNSNGNKIAISSNSASALTEVYISDIVFFDNKDDAEKYVKQYNEFYADEFNPVVDPIYESTGGYTRITFADENNQKLRESTPDGNYILTNKSDADLANDKYPYSADSMHGSAASIGRDYPSFVIHNGIECVKPAAALVKDYGGDYGFAFTVNKNHVNYDKGNRNYAVITYAAEAETSIEFRLTWGYSLSPAVHRQVGGAYTSDAGTWQSISFPLVGDWKTGREKLGIYSNDEFYIRELVFFENAADAEAYAAKAPAYFNGEEYIVSENIPADPINDVTAKSIRYSFVEGDITASGFATVKSNGNGLEPGGSNATNNVFTYYNGGVSYVNAKGVPRGAPASSGRNKWGMSVVFNGLGKSLTNNDDVYIVTTYHSESANDHLIGIYTISHDKHVTLANVKKNTKGWYASAPIRAKDQVNASNGDSFFTKLAAREAVIYTSATDVDGLNLREIVFIADKAQAEAYATAATAYYNAIDNLDPIKYLDQNGKGKILAQTFVEGNGYFIHDMSGGPIVDFDAQYGDRNVECSAVSYKTYTYGSTYFLRAKGSSAFNSAMRAAGYKYSVMTFATETENKSPIWAYHWANADASAPEKTLLVEDISVSNGKWVTSAVAEVGSNWYTRAKNGNVIQYYSTNSDESSPLYIREIVYFTELTDAEYYASKAPEYYNLKYNLGV